MKIVAISNPKGGCGKTTLATNLTVALLKRGLKVLLADTDPQGSAQDWHAVREESNHTPVVECVGMDRPGAMAALPRLADGYDYVIIDGTAKLEERVAAAVKVADLVLVPVQPSPYDVWAAEDVVNLISARRSVTDGQPRAAFVITRAIANTVLSEEVRGNLRGYGYPLLEARITQRQSYARSAVLGCSVLDMAQAGAQPAVEEVNRVADELLALLDE